MYILVMTQTLSQRTTRSRGCKCCYSQGAKNKVLITITGGGGVAERVTGNGTSNDDVGREQLKCDGTRSETRFRLSAKPTSPLKLAGGISSIDYWQPRCAHQR